MLFAHVLFAFFTALVISLIFSRRFRRIGPWPNFWAYFFIIFLAIWAGGIWVSPVGPSLLGVYWLPFFVVGLTMGLLFAVALPRSKPRTRGEALRKADQERAAVEAFSLFFWGIILIFSIAIIARYVV